MNENQVYGINTSQTSDNAIKMKENQVYGGGEMVMKKNMVYERRKPVKDKNDNAIKMKENQVYDGGEIVMKKNMVYERRKPVKDKKNDMDESMGTKLTEYDYVD